MDINNLLYLCCSNVCFLLLLCMMMVHMMIDGIIGNEALRIVNCIRVQSVCHELHGVCPDCV